MALEYWSERQMTTRCVKFNLRQFTAGFETSLCSTESEKVRMAKCQINWLRPAMLSNYLNGYSKLDGTAYLKAQAEQP